MAQTNLKPIFTAITNPLVNLLLEKNHKEHNIFFSAKNLYNHFPLALLSEYALGADNVRLSKEAEDEDKYLDEINDTIPTKITQNNWKNFIGMKSYYPNYMHFFDEEIAKKGALPALQEYLFDKTYFPLLFAGFLHPIIHIGFGVDFGSNLVLSEGLAEAAVHSPQISILLDMQGPLDPEQQLGESQSPLEIIELVHNDKSIDGLIKEFQDPDPKIPQLPKSIKSAEKIKAFAKLWCIKHDQESVQKAIEELYTATVYLYSATAFHPTDPLSTIIKLDFFLLHTLTSVLSVRVLLPYLSIPQAILLLKSHFTVGVWLYIARGKPKVNLERFTALRFNNDFEQKAQTCWDDLIQHFGTQSDEVHVSKVIRALWIGHQLFEPNNASKDSLWFKSAVLTVDELINKQHPWSHDSLDVKSWK